MQMILNSGLAVMGGLKFRVIQDYQVCGWIKQDCCSVVEVCVLLSAILVSVVCCTTLAITTGHAGRAALRYVSPSTYLLVGRLDSLVQTMG